MKIVLLAMCLFSFSAFAGNGPKFVAADGSNIVLNADGTCSISGYVIQPSENTLATGTTLCRYMGKYNTDSSLAAITGTYGGSFRNTTDVNTSVCRIDSSGIDANMATCGTANP